MVTLLRCWHEQGACYVTDHRITQFAYIHSFKIHVIIESNRHAQIPGSCVYLPSHISERDPLYRFNAYGCIDFIKIEKKANNNNRQWNVRIMHRLLHTKLIWELLSHPISLIQSMKWNGTRAHHWCHLIYIPFSDAAVGDELKWKLNGLGSGKLNFQNFYPHAIWARVNYYARQFQQPTKRQDNRCGVCTHTYTTTYRYTRHERHGVGLRAIYIQLSM